MIQISDAIKRCISRQDKKLIVHFLNSDIGDLGNENLPSEQLQISESLCEEGQVRFGSCVAAAANFTVAGVETKFVGLEYELRLEFDGIEDYVPLGIYTIEEAKRQPDRTRRKITSYNRMRWFQRDVSDWYAGISFPTTQSEMLISLLNYIGIEFYPDNLQSMMCNGNVTVEQTINPSKMTGLQVLEKLCEINGVFGQVDRYGKFKLVKLNRNVAVHFGSGDYIDCEYEDYVTYPINALQIRQEDGDIGCVIHADENENLYVVENNFLVYGKNSEELQVIAEHLGSVIFGVSYRPMKLKVSDIPWLEVGDFIRVDSDETLESYVLNRQISGVQAMNDTLESEGEEFFDNEVEGANLEIEQLRGKANKLERTVEHTLNEVSDLSYEINGDEHKRGIKSIVEQLASQIITEIVEESGEVLSRFSQSLGKFIFEGESFEIHTENIDISGTTFSVDDGYIGSIKIGSQGLSSEDYMTLKILADGTVECKDFRANGMGHIFLTSHHANDPDEDEECYVVTEDGFHADVNKEHHTSIAMYTNPDGTGEIAWLPEEIYSDTQKPSGMVRMLFESGKVSVRDTNGNLLPLLAQNSGGGGSEIIYSNEEHMIGYWFEQELFQKTIEIPEGAMTSDSTYARYYISREMLGISKDSVDIISYEALWHNRIENAMIPIPIFQTGSQFTYSIVCGLDSGNFYVGWSSGLKPSYGSIYLTVRYITKIKLRDWVLPHSFTQNIQMIDGVQYEFSASSQLGTRQAYRIADARTDALNGCWHSENSLPQWVQIHSSKKIIVQQMSFVNRGSYDQTSDALCVKNFKLQASNNEIDWIDIGDFENQYGANVVTEFAINYSYPDCGYTYYRIHATSNWKEKVSENVGDYVSIGEVNISGKIENIINIA